MYKEFRQAVYSLLFATQASSREMKIVFYTFFEGHSKRSLAIQPEKYRQPN